MNSEQFVEQVVAEMAAGEVRPTVWGMAASEANGNEEMARAIYVRLRVGQLAEDAQRAAGSVDRASRRAHRDWNARFVMRGIGAILIASGFIGLGPTVAFGVVGAILVLSTMPLKDVSKAR